MISSATNPHIKLVRALLEHRRERVRERCFVVEGVRAVADALAAKVPTRLVLFAPELLESSAAGRALLPQIAQLRGSFETDPKVLQAASDTVTAQGVIAVVPLLELSPRPGLVLALDGIQDPGNVGTLLRTAEAAGAGMVVCLQGTADPYQPKVVRAAMGAHFRLPIRSMEDPRQLLDLLPPKAPIAAAVAHDGAPYDLIDWSRTGALIIGSEAHGVSAAALKLASLRAMIPMAGNAESLNAAIAGAVLLFEALRQRRALKM